MNQLETAIKKALDLSGSSNEANKAYLEFIKANFIIPVEKSSSTDDAPKVLYTHENNQIFLPVFSSKFYLDSWAQEISNCINILTVSGVDLLKGIGSEVTVCLNIGSSIYKEFNPSEIERMRSMVIKFFSN